VTVTAAHVNALFVPGFKEWKVDTAAVTRLLGGWLGKRCGVSQHESKSGASAALRSQCHIHSKLLLFVRLVLLAVGCWP
jgi:hypothetical protein